MHDWRISGAAALAAFAGTTIASISPSSVILWSGTLTTCVLGIISLYQRYRQTKRQEDLADAQAMGETWKARYTQAAADATFYRDQLGQAQKGSNEWKQLFEAKQDGSTLSPAPSKPSEKPPSTTGSGG